MRRNLLFAFRTDSERRGIVLDPSFTTQVPAERAQRRQLARDRGPRVALPVQIGHEGADRSEIEMRRLERLDWHAPHLRGETEELRDVALVGGGCMSGGVAIQPEIFEKLAELLRHRANAG